MIQIAINKTCASVQHIEPITSGAINAKVQVTFDGSWNGLNKTAVFTNGAITKDVLESQWAEGNIISIPPEVLTPNAAVRMGVYGYNLADGVATAVPSVYVQLAKIRVGADPLADITTDPTLPVYAQLQWEIDHFEISPEQIAEQVQEYLEEHPIEIQPATETVLGAVKVGDGLSVTPDGTLSADSIDAYTKAETDALLDGKADAADIPSLDGYATESYVQNYHDNTKQDVITDLASIRSGAALGATALQSVPNTYRTAAQQDIIDNGKQDTLIAGANITIAADGKTISATGGGAALPETTALLKGDGDGGALAAEAGTDYFAPDEDGNIVLEDAGVELKTNAKGVKLTGANPDGTPYLTIEDVNNPDEPVVINGVAAPVVSTQAANKGYVDDNFALNSDIPQNVSELTNDSGYLTLSTLPIYDGSVV